MSTVCVRVAVAAVTALLAACGDGSGPGPPSLAGTWDLVGFSDQGVEAVTTGTWVFRGDGTFRVDGTVTFPGEPTDSLILDGTYFQLGNSVTLTSGAGTGTWTITALGNDIILTEQEPPPANTITLRR